MTGATVRPTEFNQVDIQLGGSSLVAAGRVSPLKVTTTGTLDPPLNTLQVQETTLQWARDGYAVAGFGGELGAMVQGVNDVIPRYMHDLDTVAQSLVTTVNTIHNTGQGQDPINDVNLDFFDPTATTAATIKLSSDVDGQPSRIALGALGGGALDGSVGHQLGAAGALSTSPDAIHRAMIGRLGVEAQTATTRAATQARFVVEAENQRTAVSGVNLDEEMTNLVMSQRAYESSARLLSAVDEMLDTLINRTAV
jgi:flagellar hook-associated protein 1 FlgK